MKKSFLLLSGLLLLSGCTNKELDSDKNKEEKDYDKLLVCSNREDTGHYSTIQEHYIGYDEKGENITSYKINYIAYEIDEEMKQEAYDQGVTDKEMEEEFQQQANKGTEQICEEDDEEFDKYCKSCTGKVVEKEDVTQILVEQVFTEEYIKLVEDELSEYNTIDKFKAHLESGEYDDGFKGTFSCEIK